MSGLTRREAILGVSAAAAMSAIPASARQDKDKLVAKKGRLKQAVAYWCFKGKGVKLKALCKASAEMGIKGIDILSVNLITRSSVTVVSSSSPSPSKSPQAVHDSKIAKSRRPLKRPNSRRLRMWFTNPW